VDARPDRDRHPHVASGMRLPSLPFPTPSPRALAGKAQGMVRLSLRFNCTSTYEAECGDVQSHCSISRHNIISAEAGDLATELAYHSGTCTTRCPSEGTSAICSRPHLRWHSVHFAGSICPPFVAPDGLEGLEGEVELHRQFPNIIRSKPANEVVVAHAHVIHILEVLPVSDQ
jgi:hypothetical protein